jgi:hypothetical protein
MTRPEAERATGWPQSGGGAEFWSLDAVQWLGQRWAVGSSGGDVAGAGGCGRDAGDSFIYFFWRRGVKSQDGRVEAGAWGGFR